MLLNRTKLLFNETKENAAKATKKPIMRALYKRVRYFTLITQWNIMPADSETCQMYHNHVAVGVVRY